MAHKSGGPVARAVAQTALGIPDSKRIMTAIRLSDSGMSDRTYPTLLSKLGNRCNWLSVAGQSMGGVAAIEGLRMLSKLPEGRRIPLGRVVLFGTPLRIENVRNDFIADVMAKAARMYGGGLGGRILSNIGVEAKSGRRGLLLDVLSGFRHSTYKALQGDSPFIEATGLALLNDTHLLDNYRDMRGIIGPNTRFAFVSSDQDNVVDCDKAVEDWGNFVSDCGGQFSHFRSRPGTGHANVEVGSEELPHWIEGTNDFY
jgi:hypothetical protein